jgi:DNA-binding transcriptional ArsR family regulator
MMAASRRADLLFASPVRRRILRLVANRPLTAGAIARAFPTHSRPAISQHLTVLRSAGLLTLAKDGNQRIYRTNRAAVVVALAELRDELLGHKET